MRGGCSTKSKEVVVENAQPRTQEDLLRIPKRRHTKCRIRLLRLRHLVRVEHQGFLLEGLHDISH